MNLVFVLMNNVIAINTLRSSEATRKRRSDRAPWLDRIEP